MAGRRANNEGSIFQRKSDLRWVVQITINGETKPFYRKTQDEAVELLKEFHRQQIIGMNISASDEPFESYAGRWMHSTVKGTIHQNTWEDYAALLKNHILPVLGQKSIGSIQTADVQGLYDSMNTAGKSSEIIRKTNVVIGMLFRSMLPDRLVDRDPTQGTKRPRLVKAKKRLFTDEQEKAFFDIVSKSKSQFVDVLKVYFELGGRISEVLGLKWSAVFSDHVMVENALISVIGGMRDSDTKTASSRRKVYLATECMAVINKQPRRELLDDKGNPKKDSNGITIMSDYVFCTKNGKPHSDRNWRRQWDQWLVRALGAVPLTEEEGKDPPRYRKPLIKITPHSLRHSQAVHLFQAGWTVADVQIRGGWSSPRVLQEIYASHSAEDRQRAMAQSVKFPIAVTFTVNDGKSSPTEAEEP